jgi:hypothetical protein
MTTSIHDLFRLLIASIIGVGLMGHISAFASSVLVGRADMVVGQVQVIKNQASTTLSVGQKIYEGAVLETGNNGYLYIQTVDNGFISLRPQTRVTVELYRFDARNPAASQIRIVLHRGVMRAISGQGAQAAKDKYRLNTPVAAIGIRGTDYTVFANQETTRATVMSGGIVATPLGNACQTGSLGPCEGQSSMDLMAGQAAVLQVNRGDIKPKLLEAPELRPDRLIPPRADESQKAQDATSRVEISKPDATKISTSSTPLETVIAPSLIGVASTAPPETIFWGRWKALAQLPPTQSLEGVKTPDREWVALSDPFFLVRNKNAMQVLPSSGQYNFSLVSYEAFLLKSFTNQALPGRIENANLSIQLDARTFSTEFDFAASGYQAHLTSKGMVSEDGRFYNDLFAYGNVRVKGAMSGLGAQEAAYLFNHTIDNKNSAVGAIRWAR